MAKQYLHFPRREGQRIVVTALGRTEDIAQYAAEPVQTVEPMTALGGRINTYPIALTNPSKGRVVPRTSGGTTLDLIDVKDAQTITAQTDGGTAVSINVEAMTARDGWASADYYMLETDANGDLVIAPGREQVTLYISGAGLDEAGIAADYNTANGTALTATDITGSWLIGQPQYGGTSAKAIKQSVANKRMLASPRLDKIRPQFLMFFERGHTYGSIPQEISGESALHPTVIRAYGAGADPVGVYIGPPAHDFSTEHTVAIGFYAAFGRGFRNLIVADLTRESEMKGDPYASTHQRSSGVTFYRTMVLKASDAAPSGPNNTWDDNQDRVSGTYQTGVKGLLYEGCVWWRNGWQPGFGQNREGDLGQPPSALNHNIYVQYDCYDVTIRNNASIQAASTSWQFRSGGWLLNNISIDDCIHSSGGGSKATAANNDRGQFTFNFRQVGTSVGYLDYIRENAGAINRGFDLGAGNAIGTVDSYICHMANPDDAAEVAAKTSKGYDFNSNMLTGEVFNGVSYKFAAANRNIDGLDTVALDQRTIQRFGQAKRGVATTIPQFGEYLQGLKPQQRAAVTAEAIEYFLTPVSTKLMAPVADPYRPRAGALNQTFNAFKSSEGFRWDNPMNWSGKQTPGQNVADTANLNGNRVTYGIDTRTVASITFAGGRLKVSSGKLTATAHADAANVLVTGSGQYIAPATTGDYALRGGLLALTGISTVGVAASGQSELCLSRDVTVPAGKALRITGNMGWAGWDWTDGAAALTINGALEFEVTPVLTFGAWAVDHWNLELGKIAGQTSGFTGVYDSLRKLDRDFWHVRVRDAVGTPVDGENIIPKDVLPKMTAGWSVLQSSTARPAEIGRLQLFRSGRFGLTQPAVAATLTLAAGSTVSIPGRSYLAPGSYDLTGPGVAVTDQGATLPAGVSVTGGKLVLVV